MIINSPNTALIINTPNTGIVIYTMYISDLHTVVFKNTGAVINTDMHTVVIINTLYKHFTVSAKGSRPKM